MLFFRRKILVQSSNAQYRTLSSTTCPPEYYVNKVRKRLGLIHIFLCLQAALGPGLVFIAFSDAIRSMPAAPVWSVLFFLMCLTLGIDSLFGGLESVSASLTDLKRLSKVRIEYISGLFLQIITVKFRL